MRVRLGLTALVLATCVGSAGAFPYAHFPESQKPFWLADGRILFESNMDARETGNLQRIPYVANADGSEMRPAQPGTTAPDASVSPDGQARAFVEQGDVYVAEADGSNPRSLTDDQLTQTQGEVRWSPDGRHLSFVTETGPVTRFVEIIRSDGSSRRRVLAGVSARWLSNDEVAVGAGHSFSGPIVSVSIATRRTRVLAGEHFHTGGFDVSPDGSTIVFAVWVGWTYGDGSTLYVVPTRPGAAPRRLTPTACTIFPDDASGSLRGRCLGGTDGADRIVGTVFGDVIIAGSGGDEIRSGDGQNIIQAQWGDDVVRSGAGPDSIQTGDGADVVRSGAGRDFVRPGAGRDTVATGAGNDVVTANDGERDVVDCGPGGRDRATVDPIDSVRRCDKRIVGLPSAGSG